MNKLPEFYSLHLILCSKLISDSSVIIIIIIIIIIILSS